MSYQPWDAATQEHYEHLEAAVGRAKVRLGAQGDETLDDVSQRAQEALQVYRSTWGFTLDATELATFTAWKTEHRKTCSMHTRGASPGSLTFSFSPTTLGTKSEVTCACGANVDLTDYSAW